MRLRAKKAKSNYKTEGRWLNAVYKQNKNLIDFSFPEKGGLSSKERFKLKVKEYQSEGYSTYKSVQMVTESSSFSSKEEELFQENLFKGISSNTRSRQRFEKLTGKSIKDIAIKDIKYEGGGTYSYGDVFFESSYSGTMKIYRNPTKKLIKDIRKKHNGKN